MIIPFNRDEKENPNSDFSIKREWTPSFKGRHFLEELSRAQDFSLAEDNKHSKHVPSTRRDYIHILIEIKPLRPSRKIKFIQDYPRRLNQRIYYTCSCNNYTEIEPILWYKYKNSLCCSISCLIYCRLEICVSQIWHARWDNLCLSSLSRNHKFYIPLKTTWPQRTSSLNLQGTLCDPHLRDQQPLRLRLAKLWLEVWQKLLLWLP